MNDKKGGSHLNLFLDVIEPPSFSDCNLRRESISNLCRTKTSDIVIPEVKGWYRT